jgi:hypothetical protein
LRYGFGGHCLEVVAEKSAWNSYVPSSVNGAGAELGYGEREVRIRLPQRVEVGAERSRGVDQSQASTRSLPVTPRVVRHWRPASTNFCLQMSM